MCSSIDFLQITCVTSIQSRNRNVSEVRIVVFVRGSGWEVSGGTSGTFLFLDWMLVTQVICKKSIELHTYNLPTCLYFCYASVKEEAGQQRHVQTCCSILSLHPDPFWISMKNPSHPHTMRQTGRQVLKPSQELNSSRKQEHSSWDRQS